MLPRLADRLSAARQRLFVGRAAELSLFESILAASELPFCLLYIFGPGGVGKTTLLQAFRVLCQQAHTLSIYVDARNVEPSPDSFLNALEAAIDSTSSDSLLDILATQSQRSVVLIDTYETLAPLDDWLRDVWLPQLPANVLVVLASRNPPSLAWRRDLGWQALIQTVPLRNLSLDESRLYLTKRGLPFDQHQHVLDFTHGHPLALSLVADVWSQRRDIHFQPEYTPDIIKALLEQFVQKVPGPAHRTALEACALVRLTTEPLLAEMLNMPDVHELFAWLRELSFIQFGPYGLFPHDLAREALVADLRWRNPDWYAELHRRARTYYARYLQQTHGSEQQRVLFDYIFLHRDNPLMRPFWEWQESGSGVPDAMADRDTPLLLEMVARHEGEESARLAAYWLARQPQNVIVFRDAEQQPAGFVATVELQQTSTEDLQLDPATCAAWSYLRRNAPLRPGERAALFRFWMARDTYQAVSAIQSLIFVTIGQYYFNTPGLAFTFSPYADPEFWRPLLTYVDLARIPEADFEVGGRRYGVYGHDWRARPPLPWLELLAEREIATAPLEQRPPAVAPVVVLSQEEFEVAVRDALRDLARPDALRANPLVQSRLVLERVGTQASERERIAELQDLVQRVAEALQATPRATKWYRALYHTYLHPAPTQEQAAELLDVPFSSYRRHLKAGIEQVVSILWQWELHGVNK